MRVVVGICQINLLDAVHGEHIKPGAVHNLELTFNFVSIAECEWQSQNNDPYSTCYAYKLHTLHRDGLLMPLLLFLFFPILP
jgi:hypothetical protein